MSRIEIAPIDWAVLILYLVAVLAIGVVASFKIKNTAQYFLGSRRFGKWVMIAQSFGTGTHAEMPVSLAGIVYGVGLSGIWYQWKNLFVTPFYWMLAPLFRRFRRTTFAEVIEDRYGPWMGTIYTVFALCFFTINMASMLKGAAKVIDQVTGGNLPVNEIVVAMTVVFILYSFVGGMVASAWTDLIQGFLIIALSFMVIPLGWGVVGGFSGMKSALDARMFSLTTPQGIGPWFITVLTINGLVGIVAQPHLIASVGTGRDEYTCRVGQMYGNFVKRFCTVGWVFVGLIAAALVAKGTVGVTSLADPEEAFGFACRHLLFPGGIGLLTACFLAANMAACSAFMIDSGAMFTNGFYRRYFVRSGSDRHYLLIGRLSGLAVTLIAVAYAVFFIKRVLYSFLLTETMATFVGVSVLAGILWPRATRWGALASILAAFGANFAGYAYRHERLDHWDPNIFMLALGAGVTALIVVSLLTPREPGKALDFFYRNLQTPSENDDEAIPGATSGDPRAVAKAGRQLLLVNLFRLRQAAYGINPLQAYRTDLTGFAIGCAVAIALVACTWLLFL